MAPKFRVGQLVHHRRYRYRGVIVAYDASCQADEAWYRRNPTQPDRNQPWYHVVVDGAAHTTYVAEENLEPDADGGPVANPLLAEFDLFYHDGRYFPHSLN